MNKAQLKTDTGLPKKFFLQYISQFCDRCGNRYTQKDTHIINQNESSLIIQTICPKCKSTYMSHVIKPFNITRKIPIELDISPKEFKHFFSKKELNTDEVLIYYKKLKDIKSLNELLAVISS